MLFKKTLKVASATALWMVALLGANSAMAQTPPTYSAETLDGVASPYMIELASAALPSATVPVNEAAQFALQNVAASADTEAHVWIRVAATGVLRLPAGAPTVEIGSKAVAAGSTVAFSATGVGAGERTTGGTAFIYEVTDRNGTDPIVSVKATFVQADGTAPDDVGVTGPGTAGFMVSVHDTKEEANFGRDAMVSGGGTAFMVASSVMAVGKSLSGVNNIASAVSRFTSIKGQENATRAYQINLGGFEITVNKMHLDAATGTSLETVEMGPDGDLAADADNVNLWTHTGVNGATRFYGAGGWDFAQGFRLAAQPATATAGACSGGGPGGSTASGAVEGNGAGIMSSPLSEEDPTDDVMGGIAPAPWYLCVSISNENEVTIPAGSYSVDINLTPARTDDRPFPPMASTGNVVGAIGHDGVTVQIPFVTSYEPYTQRIVIVNRNKVGVGYAITFRAEGDGEIETMSAEDPDVTCMDNVCEGMAMGDSATVVKVADIATFTNPTRAAATVTVTADARSIDVATTMVNKMDQSTDTVVLD